MIPKLELTSKAAIGNLCPTFMNRLDFQAIWAALLCCATTYMRAQAPYSYHFTSTREVPHAVIYDAVHGQFFVSVPNENTLYVTSAATAIARGIRLRERRARSR